MTKSIAWLLLMGVLPVLVAGCSPPDPKDPTICPDGGGCPSGEIKSCFSDVVTDASPSLPDACPKCDGGKGCPESSGCDLPCTQDLNCPECETCSGGCDTDCPEVICPDCPEVDCPDEDVLVCDGDPQCPMQDGVCNGSMGVCGKDGLWHCEYEQIDGFEWGGEISCDNLDNDCDGVTDEGLLDFSVDCPDVGVGVCDAMVPVCLGGDWDCGEDLIETKYGPGAYAAEDFCDGLDNNCDGDVDEDCLGDCALGQTRCAPPDTVESCDKLGVWEESEKCQNDDECMGAGICTRTDSFQVNEETSDTQTAVAVATVSGSTVIAWHSNGQDGNNLGIYFKAIDETGKVDLVPETRANLFTLGAQQNPAVVALGADDFFVGWESDGQDGNGLGLFGRFLGLDGNGPKELMLTQEYLGDQRDLSFALGNDGSAYAYWSSKTASQFRITGSAVTAEGWVEQWQVDVTTGLDSADTVPAAVVADDDTNVVVWERENANADVFATRITNLKGSWEVTAEIPVEATVLAKETAPSIAVSGQHVYVGWVASKTGEACVYQYTAQLQGKSGPLCIPGESGAVAGLSLVALEGGDIGAVWTEDGLETDTMKLRPIGSDLAWSAAELEIASGKLDVLSAPAVTSFPGGKVLVAWAEEGDVTGLDIWARFVQVD